MKKIIRILLVLLVVVLAVRFCTNKLGSVIPFPGSSGEETTEDSGGWFRQKEKTEEKTLDKTVSSDEIKELEKELGIGVDNDQATTPKLPTTTTSTTRLLLHRIFPSREFP